MSQARFKIVFNGELMPDVALETAKENLSRLFKSDAARINALFSGSNIEIKRDLSESEADQYLSALQRAGAKVRKEQEQTAGLSLVDSAAHPALGSTSQAGGADSMTCPKCGQQQSKALECSACGIVIEKFLARQAMFAESTAPATNATSPYATPQATVAETLPEFGELKVLGIAGRIGRLRYLAWSLALILACTPLFGVVAGFFAVSEILGGVLMAALAIALSVVTIMFGVQRLHDIGWSGWLLLLSLVPVVGSVFALLLLLVPGSTEANRFGPPPPPNSRAVKILATLWLALIVLGIIAAIALPAYMGYADAGL